MGITLVNVNSANFDLVRRDDSSIYYELTNYKQHFAKVLENLGSRTPGNLAELLKTNMESNVPFPFPTNTGCTTIDAYGISHTTPINYWIHVRPFIEFLYVENPSDFIVLLDEILKNGTRDDFVILTSLLPLPKSSLYWGEDKKSAVTNQLQALDTYAIGMKNRQKAAVAQSLLSDLRNLLANHTGCELRIMPALPEKPSQYKNSYLFIKQNDTQELYYVMPSGKYEKVTINDFNVFAENINAINHNDETTLHLSEEQIKDIITSNGGHAPKLEYRWRQQAKNLKLTCEFKQKLHSQDEVLTDYTGWGRLIANLASFIFTAGGANLINLAVTGNFFFCRYSTTETHLNNIEEALTPKA